VQSLREIRRALAAHEPQTLAVGGLQHAAVALVLRRIGDVPEVLFIERAARADDPWSGHMAFPGGRIEPCDGDARDAAERETLEEVGISLAGAERLGRLDDMEGGRAAAPSPLVISAFVYHLKSPPPLVTNHEVREAFWFPVPSLLDPDRHVEREVLPQSAVRYPGILVGEPSRHVVWGLTYRFLEGFLGILGNPLPDRRAALRDQEPVR
jgi:8-oxo-dGTP pyrophosphatase MutT (NUDIX family)